MNKNERFQFNSDHLFTFLAVAECANITHASEVLGRTQSAISVQIRKLEETLGVSLFERQPRGMVLSREGQKLLPLARQISSDMRQLPSLFDNPLTGRVRVGIPDCYPASLLENVLAEFTKSHRQVEVSARFGCTSKFPELIERGQLDVAVVSGQGADFECELKPEKNVWAAGEKFELAPESAVPLAIIDRDCGWKSYGTDALDKIGRRWRISYSSENFAGVKSAIRSGIAIGVLPRVLLDDEMRALSGEYGLPQLADTQRGIIVSKSSATDVTIVMVEAIKSAVQVR